MIEDYEHAFTGEPGEPDETDAPRWQLSENVKETIAAISFLALIVSGIALMSFADLAIGIPGQ